MRRTCACSHLASLLTLILLQAALLAKYWAPILRAKASEGGLHVYVSAMQRCMQTADPLMKELVGVTASIQPRIMEVPGLCSLADRNFLEDSVWPLFMPGQDEAKGHRLLAEHSFSPCGLSRQQVQQAYPWASAFASEFPEEGPWWPGCWESASQTERRIEGCHKWLVELSDELPENDLVVLFSHGGAPNVPSTILLVLLLLLCCPVGCLSLPDTCS